jgi:hypothetical protein
MRQPLAALSLLLLVLVPFALEDPAGGRAAAPGRPPRYAGEIEGGDPLPPVASYTMNVTLDQPAHLATGRAVITYRNASSVPLDELQWHLYLNAFRDANTLFMRESGGQARGISSDPATSGWVEVDALHLNGVDLLPATQIHETVMTTTLPSALAPGAVLTLTVDFRSQFPAVFARTGWAGDFLMAGQWFPKLAVHDDRSWHNFEFHANSEFFADFGDYDVTITAPGDDVLGATGVPDGPPVHNADGTQTVRFRAANVIDFVWTASPSYQTATRAVDGVDVVLLYQPENESSVTRYLDMAEAALRTYGRKYAPYPYPRLTIVDPPLDGSGAGGMEYPMLVTGGTVGMGPVDVPGVRLVEAVTAHEIGHEWFGMTAASNEAYEPWLDEGFTEFISDELLDEQFGQQSSALALGPLQIGMREADRLTYLAYPHTPIAGTAWSFEGVGYEVGAYSKPALALTTLKAMLGVPTFDRVMRAYYERNRFRHPAEADFRAAAEEQCACDLSAWFDQVVHGAGTMNYAVTRIDAHAVTVERQDEVALPVTLAVTFADGTQQRATWDGVAAEHVFSFPQNEVVAATINPDRLLTLDFNRADDSRARAAVAPAWKGLGRWFFWMENLLLLLGGQG